MQHRQRLFIIFCIIVLLSSGLITLSIIVEKDDKKLRDQTYEVCDISSYSKDSNTSYFITLSYVSSTCNQTIVNSFTINVSEIETFPPPDMEYPCWLLNCEIFLNKYVYDIEPYIIMIIILFFVILSLLLSVSYVIYINKRKNYIEV